MIDLNYSFEAELWIYPAKVQWYFITLPIDASDEIKFFHKTRNGFGSVRVSITIGSSTWKTSGFPSKEANSFIVPIKKDVRNKEGLAAGDLIAVEIHLAVDPF